MCNAPACCRLHGLPSVVRYLLPILTKPQWLAQRRFVASVQKKTNLSSALLTWRILCFTLRFKRFSEALHLPVVKSGQFSFPHHAIVPDDSSSHADNEEVQLQGQLRGFINPWGPWAPGYLYTWNAKCPIFLGNFTPKTSNFCLKNRALGFPGTSIQFKKTMILVVLKSACRPWIEAKSITTFFGKDAMSGQLENLSTATESLPNTPTPPFGGYLRFT